MRTKTIKQLVEDKLKEQGCTLRSRQVSALCDVLEGVLSDSVPLFERKEQPK